MKEFHCKFCERFLLSGDFEGRLEVLCRRCKSKNLIRSLAGSHLVTVSLDRKSHTRANKLPLPPRVVVE